MKFNKLFLFTIFLLAILTLGAVSAEDNATAGDADQTDGITVNFNEKVYEKDLGTIDVDIPANTSGNLRAEINHVEFYNENVTGSVKIPITIPKAAFPIYVVNRDTDYTPYSIYLYFNDVELQSNHTLKVMRLSPDYEIQSFREEILQNDDKEYIILYSPLSANGLFEIYVDDELIENFTARHYNILNITKFNSLPLGNHTVRIKYWGDDYYHPFDKNFTFNVVDMTIHIPTNIILDHDDCITAKVLSHKDGKVYVFVDGVMVYSDKLDKYGEFLHSMFYNITCGQHLVEVQYNASNFSRSKQALVNVSYTVYMNAYNYIYGQENTVYFYLPEDLDENLINITINGVRHPLKIDNGWADLDVSHLLAGNYTIIYDYTGDSKYASMRLEDNFTVRYEIFIYEYYFYDEGCRVSLSLPKGANGNLEVYVDSKLYKSAPLAKGSATIYISNLAPGEYNVTARYTGNDFDIDSQNTTITLMPSMRYEYEVMCGDDESIDVFTSKDVKGYVLFNISDKIYNVTIKDGKAKLSLKNIPVGEYDIDIEYVDDKGFNASLWAYFEVLPAKIKLTNVKTSSEGVKMKVYINDKLAKNKYVTFKVDKRTVKVKTDSNGIANIKLLAGKHKIVASFKDAKVSKSVVIHKVALNSITIKRSAKKLVLTATVKMGKIPISYKKVTFKFNGKTYTAKTNANGVAKVTIPKSVLKNLKVGKSVTYQATCIGDTVKKTAIVKK